jgi:cell division protein ZapA
VSSKGSKQVVRVIIVGEEYAIRSDASPEHTRAVAAHVDEAIRRIIESGSAIDTRKAAILAALQITDELFEANQAAESLAGTIRSLSTDVRRWLPQTKVGEAGEG